LCIDGESQFPVHGFAESGRYQQYCSTGLIAYEFNQRAGNGRANASVAIFFVDNDMSQPRRVAEYDSRTDSHCFTFESCFYGMAELREAIKLDRAQNITPPLGL
jgi:hypothetical protein